MKTNEIQNVNDRKRIIFENDNLLEGLIPYVKDLEGNIPKIERHCRPNAEAIEIITRRKQLYFHIDIFGNGNTLTYDLQKTREFNCFVVNCLSSYPVGEFELYAADDIETLYRENHCVAHFKNMIRDCERLFQGEGSVAIEFEKTDARFFGIKILEGSVKDDIFRPIYLMLTNGQRKSGDGEKKTYELTVNTKSVINDNFYGTGGTIIPMQLMPENMELGYTDSHFALETAAVKRLKPNVVRLWFQVDWITDCYDDYKNGIYTFRSQKFEAVCRYIEELYQAGCDILLDFGWKTAEPVVNWFCFREFAELPLGQRQCSAPRELDLFARACVCTLKELIQTRGLTNVKFLTFFNEPNPNGDFRTPFGTMSNKQEAYYLNAMYWRKMADCVDEELKKVGLRNAIIMQGPEFAPERGFCGNIPYFGWLEEEEGCPLEIMSFHHYNTHSFELKEEIKNLRKYTNKPLIISECGNGNASMYWDNNQAQTFIDIANTGFSGMLHWTLSTPGRATTPHEWWGVAVGGKVSGDDGGTLVRVHANNRSEEHNDFIQPVGHQYPLYAMFNHYVPSHSNVLLSGTDYDGVRYAAFETPQGEYTVLVEVKDSCCGGHLNIQFDSCINKTFYLHKECKEKHYVIKSQETINGMIPPCCGCFEVHDTLEYDFDGQYGVYCFTTMQSIQQVKIDNEKNVIPAGESVKLSAKLIDAAGEIEWSVVAGDGFVDCYGNATMPETAEKNDIFAVKAQLKGTYAYAVAVVICE